MGHVSTSSMEASDPEVEALGALSLDQLPLRKVKPGRDYSARRARKKLGKCHKLQDLMTGPPQRQLSVSTLRKLPPWCIDEYSRYPTPHALDGSIPTPLDRLLGTNPPSKQLNPNTSPSESLRVPLGENDQSISLQKDILQHLPVPTPHARYLSLASIPPNPLLTPQRLLLVLDLNGTLLYRTHGASMYHPRPFLPEFLAYCLTNHSLLVWSSATPPNVSAICAKLFHPCDRSTLLGEWARDTLGLTSEQYASRVQVYKRLDRIWDNPDLSSTHPLAREGSKWSQANTILIDDSAMKASAQPYNLVQIPEFVRGGAEKMGGNDVLGQVVGYLEEVRRWGDVSAFVRRLRFELDGGWGWNWEERKSVESAVRKKQRLMSHEKEGFMSSDTEEEEGGVKLEG